MPRPMSPNALSISELNQRIATLLERSVPLLWVQGEISNLKQYPSGHWYFSLKDENAQVRAVMFRQKAALLKWQPRGRCGASLCQREFVPCARRVSTHG